VVWLRQILHQFHDKPSGGQIRGNLPRPMDRLLLIRLLSFNGPSSNFPWIYNRFVQTLFRHACASAPYRPALNLFITGILYAFDSERQFTAPVYAAFNRNDQRLLIPTDDIKETVAIILSENEPPQGHIKH
jgi:hypothetical protein